jgi:hypothetical protein
MQIKDLTPEQKLSVPCPVCAAAPRERCCEVRSGAFRYEDTWLGSCPQPDKKSSHFLPSSKTGERKKQGGKSMLLLRKRNLQLIHPRQ